MPRLERHTARPFPPPSDALGGAQSRGTTAAIACLEALRSRGARFLLVPPATDDWLGRQRGFRWHLESRSRKLFADGDWSLFALGDRVGEAKPWRLQLESLVEEYEASSTDPPSILEWGRDPGVASRFPWRSRFESRDERDRLPFLDDSFDLVVEASGSAAARDEARRVAREAAIAVGPGDGARALEIERLRRPRAELPSASIVIPTHDGATLLNRCLGTLAETIPECVEVELLIVDDASSDSTASVVERWRDAIGSLKMVRNDTNLGFIESCNAGAAAASGEALVFLNNDTLPLPGWLVPLLRSLREPDVGAVGGKVVYPDGRLQEAGAVVFSTGDCANFGRDEGNPDAPLFQYVREVDYCSGALLATPRAQFIEMGGFDLEFRPAYYEDVDYAFRVRRAGGRVLYQPESVIVHDEGASATEVKRFQAINRPKFAARWAAELAHQPDPPAQWGPATWYGLAGRGTRETDWA
jgi:GT2 family glycosyltransferase